MIPLLPALALAIQVATPPAETPESRFARCAELASGDGATAGREASRWVLSGGGFLAQQCLGRALTTEKRYDRAAAAFTEAARGAAAAKDARAPDFWAQAGNAWLAAGDSTQAKSALDTALSGGLSGLALGEAHLDRARTLVAAGDLPAARSDIDVALVHADADPLAWLLSATLARRAGDLKRAQADIAKALERSGDDASVQLEAGNIAAVAGDEAGARAGWTKAAQIGGTTPVAAAARAALAQFEGGK